MSVVILLIGLIYLLFPRFLIQLHTFFWVRGGEPSEFGVGLFRLTGMVFLGMAALSLVP